MILPVECGLLEGVREGWLEPCEVDDIIGDTMEGVEACMPILDHLSDALHDVRVASRRIVAGWTRSGVQSRLIDVQLAPYDGWRGSTVPTLRLLVQGVDDTLNTCIEEVRLENAHALEREMAEVADRLRQRQNARAELARMGASGSIDQLALNAIAHFGDVAETLRRFATEWRFWLPDWTALLMRDGEVTAGNGTANPAMHIGRRSITIDGARLPESELVAAVGRPVTDFVDHAFLSPDMIVVGAKGSDDGHPMVTFDLAVPEWLFCSVSGRVWPMEDGIADVAPPDNVVALRAR